MIKTSINSWKKEHVGYNTSEALAESFMKLGQKTVQGCGSCLFLPEALSLYHIMLHHVYDASIFNV